MSDKLRDALLAIQGTCQEVAHEVEDPTRAVAEIEAVTRKALRAKAEPVVPLSEVREALLEEVARIRARGKNCRSEPLLRESRAEKAERLGRAWGLDNAAAGLEGLIAAAFASTDSEGQGQ